MKTQPETIRTDAKTGELLRVHADTIGAALLGISALSDMLNLLETEHGRSGALPAGISAFHTGALPGAIRVLASAALGKLAFALGDNEGALYGRDGAEHEAADVAEGEL